MQCSSSPLWSHGEKHQHPKQREPKGSPRAPTRLSEKIRHAVLKEYLAHGSPAVAWGGVYAFVPGIIALIHVNQRSLNSFARDLEHFLGNAFIGNSATPARSRPRFLTAADIFFTVDP